MHNNYGLDLSGKTSYVYFIRLGDDGPIKIGYTKNIKRRLITIQVDNPLLVRLIAVMVGGRKEEYQLHRIYSKYRLYGEWFEPSSELLGFISQFDSLNIVSADFQNPIKKGREHYNWKGDLACDSSKRQRARAFTRARKKCERCKKSKGIDTVYKDGNKDNLNSENIVLYCRRCRMELDGTLEIIKNVPHEKKDLRPCCVCKTLTNYFSHGRCHSCSEFFRRNGYERSEKIVRVRREGICKVCSDIAFLAKGRCHVCYEFFRRNGFDKNLLQKKDIENEQIIQLSSFTDKMSMDKARLIRKLYNTKLYTQKFFANKAGISISYLNDIIRNRYFTE